jgi:hypothetical protein
MLPPSEIRWDGPVDEVPSTARKVVGGRAYRRLWSAYRWISGERSPRTPLPVSERLELWRHGFHTDSAALYAFPRNDPAEYVSDLLSILAGGRMNAWEGLLEHRLGLRAFLLARGFAQPETAAFIYEGRILAEPFTGGGRYVSPEELERRLWAGGGDAAWVVKPEDRSGSAEVLVLRPGERLPSALEAIPGSTLVERLVEQGEFGRGLYAGSTNTLRILTLWTPGEPVPFVARAVQRIGTATTGATDDWSRGGISSLIDRETGRLGPGRVLPLDGPSPKDGLTHHPDSGARIAGATLPGWPDIMDTVLRAAASVPFNRMVAWDLVTAADGVPVILSADGSGDLALLQVHGGLLTDPHVRRFYEAARDP